MHELAITTSLLTIALDQARAAGAGRIVSIRLKVGELTGYVPEAVETNFRALSAGTAAEGAALLIERAPLRCTCRACGREYPARPDDFTCPDCRGSAITITGGREMFIESMEVESPVTPQGKGPS
ncbi:MAG: hydrogenase maturation nickel metallochaperone HypA [Candidatus Edwardsbacteria bacterium]|jgi:hydrogenase nickel incorporation protein HypA/HybF|nr:hydrogenase maturation nickel metallochaperone HypA [Candidatus Edwardsbacteria bacterium]